MNADEIINDVIEREKKTLDSISQSIWKNPELGFHEVKAHDLLCSILEERKFKVKRNYYLPTAFRAEYGNLEKKEKGVSVCVLCEYDALPEIGHACGHNLISETGIGAALAIKAVLDADVAKGKLVVLGTPAEEGGGGKIVLITEGAFRDIDFALMVHPAPYDLMNPSLLAVIRVVVDYFGKEAHAAIAPWEGLNALDAAVTCYNNISLMRQQMRPSWRVHGVINKGGTRPNIIPAETQLTYYLRAPNTIEAETLKSAAIRCFEGAARATGCKVQYEFLNKSYESFLYIKPLQSVYKKHAESFGIEFSDGKHNFTGSTDMGNVSQVVPSIHPTYKINTSAANHTREFAQAAGSSDAQVPTLIAAKCLAMTAIDLLTDKELQTTIRAEFSSKRR